MQFLGRKLPFTTAALAVGLLAMFAWEDPVGVATSVTRVGRLTLVLAMVALVIEMGGPGPLWRLRGWLKNGPALVLLVGSVLTVVLIAISSHTNGCDCSGSATGIYELWIWTALALIVVLAAPDSAITLLAAAVLGCFVAGVLALAGAHGAGEMNVGNQRLAGTYGNSNYFGATQAVGLPLALAVVLQAKRVEIRLAAAVIGVTLAAALLLSYSRAGILGAAGGVLVTIVMITPSPRRLPVAMGLVVAGTAAGAILYPTFNKDRTNADLGHLARLYQQSDASGWIRAADGLIGQGPSQLTNAGPLVLQVVALRSDEGVSIPLYAKHPLAAYRLRFQARAPGGPEPLRFALEDNLIAAGPERSGAQITRRWQSLELSWRPIRQAKHPQAYFWLPTPGAFELRDLTVSESGAGQGRLPTRLLGPLTDVQGRENQLERSYIRSRESAARIAIDAFTSHPLFGVGWAKFQLFSKPRSGVGRIATHDEYLEFAAELGVLGVAAVLLLVVATGWAALEVRNDKLGPALLGALVAAALVLGFGNMLDAPSVVLPLGAATAVAVALSARRRGGPEIAGSAGGSVRQLAVQAVDVGEQPVQRESS